MNTSDIQTLFDYNYWANQRVLDAVALVNAEQYFAPAETSHGSLRGTLVHILAAEIVWRMRCADGISPSALPAETEFPTLDDLVERWRAEERVMRTYLNRLTDDDLHAPVRYSTTQGTPHENNLWQMLVHVVNHGTQFRAEAAVILTGYGTSPGDLDLILYLRERK